MCAHFFPEPKKCHHTVTVKRDCTSETKHKSLYTWGATTQQKEVAGSYGPRVLLHALVQSLSTAFGHNQENWTASLSSRMQKSHNLRHLDQRDSFPTKDVLEQIEKNKMVFLERASHAPAKSARCRERLMKEMCLSQHHHTVQICKNQSRLQCVNFKKKTQPVPPMETKTSR